MLEKTMIVPFVTSRSLGEYEKSEILTKPVSGGAVGVGVGVGGNVGDIVGVGGGDCVGVGGNVGEVVGVGVGAGETEGDGVALPMGDEVGVCVVSAPVVISGVNCGPVFAGDCFTKI